MATSQGEKQMDYEDKKKKLFPVRCPFQRLSKSDGKLYRCNSLCVKVSPNSSGEARCRKCCLTFNFECDSDGVVNPFVNVQPIPKKEPNK